ncbi:hypothetical protein CN445_14720 [Bacillus cereus]|nr:hypothetical protein CN445_14720 [Bacillus cereus]PFN71371.1 hypothetical protein COJ62_19870 [Bacillus cereus]GCF75223.1 hypothetical protein BC2926_27640 [Bacillus cereus]
MLWKVYLVIVAILTITSLVRGMYQTPIQKFDFVLTIITWIGLFGFVFDVEILIPLVWKCIFVFSVIWTWSAVFVLRLYEEKNAPLPFIFKLIGIIPTLPLYYGVYQYAFKKKTMMVLTHHCLFYFAFCFIFYFASYINHSSEC